MQIYLSWLHIYNQSLIQYIMQMPRYIIGIRMLIPFLTNCHLQVSKHFNRCPFFSRDRWCSECNLLLLMLVCVIVGKIMVLCSFLLDNFKVPQITVSPATRRLTSTRMFLPIGKIIKNQHAQSFRIFVQLVHDISSKYHVAHEFLIHLNLYVIDPIHCLT